MSWLHSEPRLRGSDHGTAGPPKVMDASWRTHFCVPRSHSFERPGSDAKGVRTSANTARKSACATGRLTELLHNGSIDVTLPCGRGSVTVFEIRAALPHCLLSWRFVRFILLLAAALPLAAASPPTLLDILNDELQRNFSVLKQKADPPPYYMAYAVTEEETQIFSASLGALNSQHIGHLRYLDVTVRVGSPKLDNYHIVNGQRARFTSGAVIALDDVPDAIRQKVWLETDRTYRLAARRLIEIKSAAQSKVKQEDDSDDFSVEPPSVHEEQPPRPHYPDEEWKGLLRKWSAQLGNADGVLSSNIVLAVERETKYLVSTEGTRLLHGRTFANISITAQGKAADGMDLSAMQDFQGTDLDRLPKTGGDRSRGDARYAPTSENCCAPRRWSRSSAPRFFPDAPRACSFMKFSVTGWKDIARRMKPRARHFTKAIGTAVLPNFLSVVFDPTRKAMESIDLNGTYSYDDEGVKAGPSYGGG